MIKGGGIIFLQEGNGGDSFFQWGITPPANVAKVVTLFRETENEESFAKAQKLQNLQRN